LSGHFDVVKYLTVYRRKQSPWWWIAYWDGSKQKRVFESTPFRLDDPQGKRKALNFATPKARLAGVDKGEGGIDRWERWVDDMLLRKYGGRPKTYSRMRGGWQQWRTFLQETGVFVPRGLQYRHILDFIEWRSSQRKQSSGRQVSKNTALCDVRVMSVILGEAVKLGFADGNVAARTGIPKDKPEEKPEIADEEIATIRKELESRPEWMRVSFEIAIHQGCRLNATQVLMSGVDLKSGTIQFREKRNLVFTAPLHPKLRPMMEKIKADKRRVACEHPKMAAKEWHNFFREVNLPHLCFHCTRVTVVTRMARAGVPIQQAMAFVGHASTTIHKIYQRLKPADAAAAVAALNY
jgi:integrase